MLLNRRRLFAFGSAVGVIGVPLLTQFAAAAQAADPADIDSLNSAIALERAGIKAYADAAHLLTPPVAAIAARFVADHTAHRDALIGAVRSAGAVPSDAVAPIATPPLATERDALAFALTVEEKAASTYLSVIPDLKNRALAGVAASILGVETTHVSVLSGALGTRVYASGFVV
jgi:rubrerythrin